MTYIKVTEDGKCEYNDGFCCGSLHHIPTREDILHHCTDRWYDDRDVWIGNRNDSKARYVQDQWIKFLEEYESGNTTPGMRYGWFNKDENGVVKELNKFITALHKIGYDVDDKIATRIFKIENYNKE